MTSIVRKCCVHLVHFCVGEHADRSSLPGAACFRDLNINVLAWSIHGDLKWHGTLRMGHRVKDLTWSLKIEPGRSYLRSLCIYHYCCYCSCYCKPGIHNPWAGTGPQTCYIQPSQQVTKYKKLLVNDGDLMNEFKLLWTINNFATYYNQKQLWWQQ